MICRFLYPSNMTCQQPTFINSSEIVLKLPSGNHKFLQDLGLLNDPDTYSVTKEGLWIKSNKIVMVPLELTIGLPKNYYFKLTQLTSSYDDNLILLDNPIFYGTENVDLNIKVLNRGKKKILIPFEKTFVQGEIIKTKKIKVVKAKRIESCSGVTRSEFFTKTQEIYDNSKKEKSKDLDKKNPYEEYGE